MAIAVVFAGIPFLAAILRRSPRREGKEPEKINLRQYLDSFDEARLPEAYRLALDTRKFEIDLYWRRATYFWAFIAAALAAYGAVQQIDKSEDRYHLSVIAACLGLVFSFAWYCVNRGSKQWQENWENHISLLEGAITGPLFATKVERLPPEGFTEWLTRPILGPASFSVSKINQMVSLFVALLWLPILLRTLLPVSPSMAVDWFVLAMLALTEIACVFIWTLGRTAQTNHDVNAWRSRTDIKPPDESRGRGRQE